MRHLDPDDLALLALGEPVEGARHLEKCPECAAEVASLARVVTVARTVDPEDVPEAPHPDVWRRISAELQLGQDRAPSTTGGADGVGGVGEADGVVRPLRRPGRRLTGWIAAAAAAGVVVGATGGAWWVTRTAPGSGTTVLAETVLEPLPGWEDAAGNAVVRESGDGDRVVAVDVAAPQGGPGYREVWLIAADLSGMVSLGLLEGEEGEFVIPSGLDLAVYPVVDVSEEPFDGDATHSGNSVVRGTLDV